MGEGRERGKRGGGGGGGGGGQFQLLGYNLNNLCKGPQDEAAYQISKAWAF